MLHKAAFWVYTLRAHTQKAVLCRALPCTRKGAYPLHPFFYRDATPLCMPLSHLDNSPRLPLYSPMFHMEQFTP